MVFLDFEFATGEVKLEEHVPQESLPSLHDDPVGLETSPELFISVHSTHKAPSGDTRF